MIVATGLAPSELLELDPDLFESLERAVAERWGAELELAALNLELLSLFFVTWLQSHLRRGARGLEPITIPRPAWWRGEPEEATPAGPLPPMSVRELASFAGKRVEVARGE